MTDVPEIVAGPESIVFYNEEARENIRKEQMTLINKKSTFKSSGLPTNPPAKLTVDTKKQKTNDSFRTVAALVSPTPTPGNDGLLTPIRRASANQKLEINSARSKSSRRAPLSKSSSTKSFYKVKMFKKLTL